MYKLKSYLLILFISLIFILSNCAKQNPLEPVGYSKPGSVNNYVYVLNQPFGGNGYVSKVNVDSGFVISKYITAGSIPNDIIAYNYKLYILNSGDDTLQIYDIVSGKNEYVNFPNNSSPEIMDLYNGKLYVSLWESSKISVVNLESKSIETNIKIPSSTSGPWGVKVVNNRLFVACTGTYISWGNPGNYTDGKILVYNISDYSAVTNFNDITNANGLTADDAGNVYCAAVGQYNDTGKVYKIDASLNISTVLDTGKNGNYVEYDNNNSALFLSDASWTRGTDGVYKIVGSTLSTVYSTGNQWSRVKFAVINNEFKGMVCNSAGELYIFDPANTGNYTKYTVGNNPVKAIYANY